MRETMKDLIKSKITVIGDVKYHSCNAENG